MEFPSALDPLRSIQAVWRAVRASPGAIGGWWALGLGAGLLIYLSFYVVVLVLAAAGGVAGDASPAAGLAFGGALIAFASAFGLVAFVLQCGWRVGLENVLADTLRTGRSTLADAWKPRGRMWPVVGAHLLVGLLTFAAYLPFFPLVVLVGLVSERNGPLGLVLGLALGLVALACVLHVALGLSFAPFAAALDPIGPLEAVRRAWRAARGRRLALLVFWLATVVFALAGFLLLCVGYLATAALLFLMPAEAWLALTRAEERAQWWISTGVTASGGAPPEPGATAP